MVAQGSVASKVHLSDLLKENAATEETQAARLEALRGKVCLWVTAPLIPMMSGVMRSRLQWVRSQGVHVCGVFQSKEDKLYQIMEQEGVLNSAIFCEMMSGDVAKNIVDALGPWSQAHQGLQINSVFSPYEHCVTIVGEVGTLLGLQASTCEAYSVARSKNRTRDACRAAGLPTPRTGVCSTVEELATVCSAVGFPLVLKPSSGAGSAGVYRAKDMKEAVKAFKIIEADVRSSWSLNWNPGCGKSMCLVEEMLVGPEFDVDILMWDGVPMYIRTVDNWECLAPFFLETGSNMPSLFPADVVKELEEFSVDCVKACGFSFGCFHVESIVTAQGPRLIEVNARQGGGSMQEFNNEMHGVDIFANFFIATFGIPINPPVKVAEFAMADYSITSPKTGIIKNIAVLQEVADASPNVFRCTAFVKDGDRVVGIDGDSVPQWLGEFLVKAPTASDAARIANELKDAVYAKLVIETEEPVREVAQELAQVERTDKSAVAAVEAEDPSDVSL